MNGRVSRRSVLVTGGALAAGGGLAAVGATAWADTDVTPASTYDSRIDVDASRRQGTFFNPGWYINHTHPNWFTSRGLLPPRTLAQLQNDFNVRWARVVVRADNFFDPATGRYEFANNYPYLDQAASYANRLLLNFVSSTGMRKTPAMWEELMRNTLLDHKVRYPTIDSVMPWIEPNLGIVGGHPDQTAMTPQEFYPFYAAGYRAVQAVNAQLAPAVPLTYGGPTTSNLPEAWLADFLRRYAADRDDRKRLDFLSVQLYHRNRDQPRQILDQRVTMRRLLREAGLPEYLPPYITEYGVYPGTDTGDRNGSTDAADLAHDQLVQACGVAALGRYFIDSGINRPFHWVVHHGQNLRKDMFVEGLDGVRLPFGHVVVMQGMLKDRYDSGERVAARISPDANGHGLGLGAIAHVDPEQLTIMYWNYQAENGRRSYQTRLAIENPPRHIFGGERIRVESWLVDQTHNNYNHNRATEFTRNTVFRMVPPQTFLRIIPVTPNAIGLLRITRATAD